MLKIQSTFNHKVVISSLLICISIIVFLLFEPALSIKYLNVIKQSIFKNFSWFYILTSTFFVFFLVFLSVSRYGDIKLGDDNEEPEFNLTAWFSLLFTAGMGIGIIFLGVSEPLSHVLSPITNQYIEKQALFQSIFHWSINAWAIYGIIALAIAYFGFRYKLPLSLRSCFYPLFKQRIEGNLGDIIDILGICTTLFGITTTLCYSAVRLTSAFAEHNITIQFILGAVGFIAILISLRKLSSGLQFVSHINLILSICLMLFVLFVGPTSYLLSAFTENIGYYFSSLIQVGFKTYIYQPEYQSWFTEWTILYWAWWFSWAPSFGIFIARISRGRTIREFIFGVLIVPSIFFILWFTIFGNGAIWINENIADGKLNEFIDQSGKLLFTFLSYLPFSKLSYYITFIIILLFFITTIDFGVYILNNISSKDKSVVSPRWQIIMWGIILAISSFTLFQIGGIEALQATMLIFSLPFAISMIIMTFSLLKGLRFDYEYYNRAYDSQRWLTDDWRESLTNLLTSHDQQDSISYLKTTALIAMREVRQELIGIHELDVHLENNFVTEDPSLVFTIKLPNNEQFNYILRTIECEETTDNNSEETSKYYKLQICNSNVELPYEIHHLSKNELIADILQNYEQSLLNLSSID
ncbi:choline/glycine/proline betaine transport protein [Bisgaardia hudsonensis]|uniref:Choline/glycine/proline betaine transport protein n=1 Tax=Bisgaardia hudsonensis TaxID=109472 RepID=A0A4R2N179_9PAST|nr:BCCT family transporter [Bisgaardia hudsonensis]QLB13139.1 choline transporter [Bisgaardia hudsonensis]TCP13289.1 choline/glycine/proline betaine transport protein [Bisgaardia hudsonensis]